MIKEIEMRRSIRKYINKPVLNIPSDKYVLRVITVGYSNETPKARPRKNIEDIVHYKCW